MSKNCKIMELPGNIEVCVRVKSTGNSYEPAVTVYFPCGCMYSTTAAILKARADPDRAHEYALGFVRDFSETAANELVAQCQLSMADGCKHGAGTGTMQ